MCLAGSQSQSRPDGGKRNRRLPFDQSIVKLSNVSDVCVEAIC